MRRRLFALEAAPVGQTLGLLSLEEEAVVVDEAAVDNQEIAEDLAEAERTLEVSDSLEDLAVVAQDIEEATPTETALIENAAQMAVAGTDVEPEQVVPAMESFIGKRIAVEGIRDQAKKIWENIQRVLKAIWERIMNFFRVNVVIPTLRARLEGLKKGLEGLDKVKDNAGKFTISAGANSLAVGGKAPTTGAEVIKNFGEFAEAAVYVFGTNAENVASRGKEIAKIVGDFEPSKSNETLANLTRALSGSKFAKIPGAKAGKKEGDFEIQEGPELMGGGKLRLRTYQVDETDSPLGAIDRLRTAGVELEAGNRAAAGSIEFKTMEVPEMKKAVDLALSTLKGLEEFHKGSRFSNLKSAGDDLRSASNKATAAMNKMKDGDTGGGRTVAEFRSLVNFNAAYARWVQQPAIPMTAKTLSAVRTIAMLVAKSAAQYEAPAKAATK